MRLKEALSPDTKLPKHGGLSISRRGHLLKEEPSSVCPQAGAPQKRSGPRLSPEGDRDALEAVSDGVRSSPSLGCGSPYPRPSLFFPHLR